MRAKQQGEKQITKVKYNDNTLVNLFDRACFSFAAI